MSASLRLRGARVEVGPPLQGDLAAYRRAVEASAHRLERWNAVDPLDLERHLRSQSDAHRTFVVRALDRQRSHGIVAKINVTNVVRGRFSSASLGYDAYDPYVGRGLFSEGLRLVVEVALRPTLDGGMGLHRLEASVQPGNVRSARVLRSLGFRHEGETPRMLYLAARGEGADGRDAWRDHERYALTREEWPAPAWAPHRRARRVVLLNGPCGPLAAALSDEMVLPLLDGAALHLLEHCPSGAVVAGSWTPDDRPGVAAAFAAAGLDPTSAAEVLCGDGAPLGLGPVLRVDPAGVQEAADVVRLALEARALTT